MEKNHADFFALMRHQDKFFNCVENLVVENVIKKTIATTNRDLSSQKSPQYAAEHYHLFVGHHAVMMDTSFF